MLDLLLRAVLALLVALVSRVAFADLRVLGAPVGFFVGSVLRVRRAQVEAAVARAGIERPGEVADGMYAGLAAGVMELFWLAGEERDLRTVAEVEPASLVQLESATAGGRGVVLAASHTGNWELAACALAARRPLSVLVKPVSLAPLDRFMTRLRRRYGVGLLDGHGAVARARAELRRGGAVAVLLDQVPPTEAHATWVPFLGADALTDRAAASLAASADVPLVVTASRREADGRHRLAVLSVKVPPEGATPRQRVDWARQATREASAELDAFVRAYPDQWLWLHRRWRGSLVARRAGR